MRKNIDDSKHCGSNIVDETKQEKEERKRQNEYDRELNDLKELYAIVHAQRDKLAAEVKELKARLEYYHGIAHGNWRSVVEIKNESS